jgi:hypothetical protein
MRLLVLVFFVLLAVLYILHSGDTPQEGASLPLAKTRKVSPSRDEPSSALNLEPTASHRPRRSPVQSDATNRQPSNSDLKLIVETIAGLNSKATISEMEMAKLRQVAWEVGDKAIVQFGDRLARTDKTRASKEEATEIVNLIDALDYFAAADWSEARNQIARLATEPVVWTEKNRLAEPTKAKISFEAFQLFSKYDPVAAKDFMKTIDPPFLEAYVYHFVVGRKADGELVNEIATELKTELDPNAVEAAMR